MQKFSLEALGRQLLERAGAAGGGHSADTVVGGHERILRQTVSAMVKGAVLAEHENPGEATVPVVRGRVRLSAGDLSWERRSGDLLVVPDARHSLEALEVSAGLLTVAKPERAGALAHLRELASGRGVTLVILDRLAAVG